MDEPDADTIAAQLHDRGHTASRAEALLIVLDDPARARALLAHPHHGEMTHIIERASFDEWGHADTLGAP